jgi:uncharacterized protein (TIGR01777 family)
MGTFERRSVMPAPADELFRWHEREGAFERLNSPWAPVEVEERTGGLAVGARTVIRLPVGPVKQRWVAEHTAYEPGRMFRDKQTSGPFSKWVHTHRFEPKGAQSELIDTIDYALPMGGLGELFGGPFTEATLQQMFDYRHAVTRMDLDRHRAFADRPRLTVAVTGASGLIGSALIPFLTTGGHVARPVKRQGKDFDAKALEGADVIVNLAGAGVADARWTASRKVELVESRVDYTRRLITALQKSGSKPRVWIQGSAVGIYGDRADEVLDEDSAVGRPGDQSASFLAKLCQDWEAAGEEAKALGARVVSMRIGIVQSAKGGALSKLLPAFKLGAGGPIAGGKGWQSWVSLEDILGIVNFAAYTDSLSGPINCTAPHPVTSLEYARVLGRVIHRPSFAPLPAFALRLMFGELADGALMASQRVLPKRLEAAGFQFQHPELEQALRFTLGR